MPPSSLTLDWCLMGLNSLGTSNAISFVASIHAWASSIEEKTLLLYDGAL